MTVHRYWWPLICSIYQWAQALFLLGKAANVPALNPLKLGNDIHHEQKIMKSVTL